MGQHPVTAAADRQPIIVILSTADYDSDVWTNKQHLASRLAADFDVLFIDSLGLRQPRINKADFERVQRRVRRRTSSTPSREGRPRPERLTVLAPQVVPLHAFGPVRWVNRWLLGRQLRRALSGRPYILWTFSPISYDLGRRARKTVYHSVDLLHTVEGIPTKTTLREEQRLVRTADHVIASSSGLKDHLESIGAADVLLWENVADTDLFSSAAATVGDKREHRMIFAGNLTPAKIDIPLLESVAETGLPLAIAGPASIDGLDSSDILRLLDRPNVTYLGSLSLADLADAVSRSKVGLIPYVLDEHTQGIFPMKVYEYLSAGCAVVSTPLASLTSRPATASLTIAPRDTYVDAASRALRSWTLEASANNIAAALPHSWPSRARSALDLVSTPLTAQSLPRRVLFVSRSTSRHPGAGGMETSMSTLAKTFQQLGASTALLTTALAADARGSLDGVDGHAEVWPVPTRKPGKYSTAWWRGAPADARWRAWRPDLIVSEGDAAASIALSTDIPIVVHSHGTTMLEASSALSSAGLSGVPRAALNLARTPSRLLLLRRAAAVLAVGDAVRESLLKPPYALPPQKVTVLPNAVDTVRFRFNPETRAATRLELGIGAAIPVALSLGRLSYEKGVDVSIDAIAATSNAHLVVAGDGPDRQALESLAGELGVGRRVHFLGNVLPTAVPSLMHAADVLLFPTRRKEGSPMVTLEACAAGLPVITTVNAVPPRALPDSAVHVVATGATDELTERMLGVFALSAASDRSSLLPEQFWSVQQGAHLVDFLSGTGALSGV